MSDKVVSIGEIKKESGPNVISIIEDILESAYKGEVQNVLIVTVNSDDSCSRAWANGIRPFTLIGQLESAKIGFIEATIEK